MVDHETWDHLDRLAQQEFGTLLSRFQQCLERHGIDDGFAFAAHWSVQRIDGMWVIANGTQILDGVTSPHREVIEALYRDGVQNLGR